MGDYTESTLWRIARSNQLKIIIEDILGNVKGTQTLAKRYLKFAHAIFKYEQVQNNRFEPRIVNMFHATIA